MSCRLNNYHKTGKVFHILWLMHSAKLCQWHSLIVHWCLFSKQRMQMHLWLVLSGHSFSFCGALFACWGWPPFQDTSVWIWWVKSVRCRSSELNSRDLWRTPCLAVVSLWWSLSVLALCLCSEPGCCVTWKNWHLFTLKKWPRIYGGSNWKLCRKLQLSALQPLVRSGLQAVLMNAQVNTKTDCGQIAHCSRAFHEVSLFTGDRRKLLPRLEERLV